MINLAKSIQDFLLADTNVTSKISVYLNSFAIFTRRPVPEDAKYPMIVVSPLVADTDLDFLRCKRRILSYDIAIYHNNDASANYRLVEELGFYIARKFDKLPRHAMTLPTGVSLVKSLARGPIVGPQDDLVKVSRVIPLELDISF